MATLGELKTYIAQDMLRPDISDARLTRAVNQAISYYKNCRTWFNEATVDITLNIGDPIVPNVPSDFLYEMPVGGLTISYSEQFYRLTKISPARYADVNVESQNIPSLYKNESGELRVYEYPDQAYTLQLFYVKNYVDLAENDDENDWTIFAPELLQSKAMENLNRYVLKDLDRANDMLNDANRLWTDLQKQINKRIGTGALMTDQLVNNSVGFLYGLNSW